MDKLSEEFISLLNAHGSDGVFDTTVKQHFSSRYSQLAEVINSLVETNRIQLFISEGVLIYKIIKEETAAKFEGLGPEQMLVYQIIEKAANKGIWTRDIKIATNIQQQVLAKTLKILEQRNLIKSVRSVISKSKKLYMLFDLEPAKEISGGAWYTDQEFDHEFIEFVSKEIISHVKAKDMADINTITEKIKASGISKVELGVEDLLNVVQTLVYDGRLEEVTLNSVAAAAGYKSGTILYKVSKPFQLPNFYTEIPCGVCPVIDRCCDGGVISPSTCEYMSKWLSASADDMDTGGW